MKPLGVFLLLLTPGLKCETTAPAGHEECERRIRELEQRLARVEGILEKLTGAPVTSVAASWPAPEPAPAADPTPAPGPAAPLGPLPPMPPELVPQIGKIGAEVGLLLSGASSPFQLNSGQYFGGFIDLPLFEPPRLQECFPNLQPCLVEGTEAR